MRRVYSKGKNDRIPHFVARFSSRVSPVNETVVPTGDEIVSLYTEAGGQITTDCSFGTDPLAQNEMLVRRRDEEFARNNPSFVEIFNDVVSGNGLLLQQAITSFISVTRNISRT